MTRAYTCSWRDSGTCGAFRRSRSSRQIGPCRSYQYQVLQLRRCARTVCRYCSAVKAVSTTAWGWRRGCQGAQHQRGSHWSMFQLRAHLRRCLCCASAWSRTLDFRITCGQPTLIHQCTPADSNVCQFFSALLHHLKRDHLGHQRSLRQIWLVMRACCCASFCSCYSPRVNAQPGPLQPWSFRQTLLSPWPPSRATFPNFA